MRTQPKKQITSQAIAQNLQAKRTLKARGWSYRLAAPELGVCYQHLALVLTGHRESRRLLARIEAIPHRDTGKLRRSAA